VVLFERDGLQLTVTKLLTCKQFAATFRVFDVCFDDAVVLTCADEYFFVKRTTALCMSAARAAWMSVCLRTIALR